MQTKLLAMTMALLGVLACGADERTGLDEKADRPAALTGTLPPMIPYAKHVGAFYSAKSNSFFTVYGASPFYKGHFQAYGVDLTQQTVAFNLDLANSDELQGWLAQVTAEIAKYGTISENAVSGVKHGIMTEIVIRIPPPPPNGGDGMVQALLQAGNISARNQLNFFNGAYFPAQ